MELIGSRSTTRAATMAPCPGHKFLAAGPAARAHGGCADGDGSRVEILRLGREEESEQGRQLEVAATIRAPGTGNACFHRLAWSKCDANSAYPLGLLAGSLVGGAVRVWDPSLLPYEQNVSPTSFFTLGAFTSFGEPSTCSKDTSSLVLKKVHSKFSKEVYSQMIVSRRSKDILPARREESASRMLLGMDTVLKGNFTAIDWELVSMPEFDEEWEVVSNQNDEVVDDGLVLELNDVKGEVLGLSFNSTYGNVLACGGHGDKIVLYHLDCHVKTFEMFDTGSKEINSQITSLDWHPVYPVLIASTCDASVAKVWDLREKKPTVRFGQENKGNCTEVRWNPSHPLQILVASTGTLASPAVEIWDARNLCFPLAKFGPENGAVSLSWCADPNIIFTTDVDGAVDAWKLNEIEGSDPSWTLYDTPDRIHLHPAGKAETLWCENEDVIAISSSSNIGLYQLKPLADGSVSGRTMLSSPCT